LAVVTALLVIGGASAWPVQAYAASASDTGAHAYGAHVAEAAQRFGIPDSWIWAVMAVESRGNPRAVSPKGAMGLMQIMPATWATLAARHGLGGDPFDIRANIIAGAAYLRELWDRYGNVTAMLAAYNAGPRRVDAYVAGQGVLPAETQDYVRRIAPALNNPGSPKIGLAVSVKRDWRASGLFSARSSGVSDVPQNARSGGKPGAQPSFSTGMMPAPSRMGSCLFVAQGGQSS
jgi:hypothetical protein